jgi:hypothetical protein
MLNNTSRLGWLFLVLILHYHLHHLMQVGRMKLYVSLIVLAGLSFFPAEIAHAQFPRFGGRQAMRMFAPFGSGFNPEKIVEITGKIKRLINVRGRMIPTVAAIVESNTGDEFEVRLGPMMFIRNMQNFSFRKGSEIDVVGSPIESKQQRKVIIATRVSIDGNETVLRDEMGIPVWAPISRKSDGGMMGGGMMGGGMMGGGAGKGAQNARPPTKIISGEQGQEIHMFGDGDAGEETEDVQGGKIPGGYKETETGK